jgi:quercetin dioxygenase-like cupin family protein
MTVRRFLFATIAVVLGAGASAGSAGATPAEGDVIRTDLAKGIGDAPVAINTQGQQTAFYVQSLLLKPAATSGWHTHSGPEYSVITRGSVSVQTDVVRGDSPDACQK